MSALRKFADVAATAASGVLFGAGLTISTMTRPESVLDFLTFRDLGLLFVLGSAVTINLLVFQLVPRIRKTALLGGVFQERPFKLDRSTLAGGAIFGIGWGLCGVCPGPALAAVGAGDGRLLVALAGIFAGAGLHGVWESVRKSTP